MLCLRLVRWCLYQGHLSCRVWDNLAFFFSSLLYLLLSVLLNTNIPPRLSWEKGTWVSLIDVADKLCARVVFPYSLKIHLCSAESRNSTAHQLLCPCLPTKLVKGYTLAKYATAKPQVSSNRAFPLCFSWIFKFLFCHNNVLMLCLSLGTYTTRSGLGKHHGSAQNICFGRHNRSWRWCNSLLGLLMINH